MRPPKPTDAQLKDLRDRFGFRVQEREPEVFGRIALISERAMEFAVSVVGATHPGRTQSLALTKIEEAMQWAHTSIIREEDLP